MFIEIVMLIMTSLTLSSLLSIVFLISSVGASLRHDIWFTSETATGDVLQNKCSWKIRNIRRKTPVLESFFNKVADIRPATLLKRDSYTGVFLLHLLHFEHLFLQDSSITFSSLIITTSGHLKSYSHLPKKVVLFSSLKALWNWWKMFFISSKKLFSFSRYLSFYHDFLVMLKKRLD